jgi:hypothetical protein
MPKAHKVGPKHFVQLTNFPFKWGFKFFVRGWTQEIEYPFRTSTPFIVRLPRYRALVFGKWTGTRDEEEALTMALGKREVTYDDFTEEAGWTPAPDSDREEGGEDFNTRLGAMDGTLNVHDWEMYLRLAEKSD